MRRSVPLLLVLYAVLIPALLFAQADRKLLRAREAFEGGKIRMTKGDLTCAVSNVQGTFTLGTSSGEALLFGFPAEGSTSHANFWVNGIVYRQSSTSPLSTIRMFSAPSALDDSTIVCTFDINGLVLLTQILTIVPRVVGHDTTSSLLIQYIASNTTSAPVTFGVLQLLDTYIVSNDTAPLGSAFGWACVETEYRRDSTGIPDFWQAYEVGVDQPDSFIIAEGTLAGGLATPPDRVCLGPWITYDGVEWSYTPRGLIFGDSAILMWWNPDTLGVGGTRVIGTYYGLAIVNRVRDLVTIAPSAPDRLTARCCRYSPDPFDVFETITNGASISFDEVGVRVQIPRGLSLVTGDTVATVDMISSVCGNFGSIGWQFRADGTVVGDTVHIRVSNTPVGSDSTILVDIPIYLPPLNTPVTAEFLTPSAGAITSCRDQEVRILIHPPDSCTRTINLTELECIYGGRTYTLDSANVQLFGDTLVVRGRDLPPGEVSFRLVHAVHDGTCGLDMPLERTFIVDTLPPAVTEPFPTPGEMVGDMATPIHFVLTDDRTAVNPSTIELVVGENTYHLGDPGLTWNEVTGLLTFDPTLAGITWAGMGSVEVTVQGATDSPDICGGNAMAPYQWNFLVDVLQYQVGDTAGNQGEVVYIPVYVDTLDAFNLTAMSMTIEVDTSILEPVNIMSIGGLISQWSLPFVTPVIDGGRIGFTASGSVPLTGAGVLFSIQARVKPTAPEAGFTLVTVVDRSFNLGTVASQGRDGVFLVRWGRPSWSVDVEVVPEGGLTPVTVTIGVMTGATDLFDGGLDEIWVPNPHTINAYFPLVDSAYPWITQLRRDVRGREILPITWNLTVASDVPCELIWQPAVLPGGLFLLNGVNMRTDSVYAWTPGTAVTITYDRTGLGYTRQTLASGWNLVSPVVIPANNLLHSLYPQHLGPIYAFDQTLRGYVPAEFAQPGHGYWVLVPEQVTAMSAGVAVREYVFNLHRGWNLVGGLFDTDVPIESLLVTPDEAVNFAAQPPYGFNGTYFRAETLVPGHGYWILSFEDAVLRVR